MPDYRKYYNKREIIKLDLVQTEDYTDNVILCVPKFAYDVARSMLAHYGKFRTSYAASYGELFYQLPDDSQFDVIEASIDLFLGSRDMSCDIVTALECICDAFQLQVAATNELVAATYTSSVNANYAGLPEQTAGEEGGSIPAGAGAPDAGITDRTCKAAHYIVDNINYMMFGLVANPPPDWYDIGDTDNYLRQLGDTSSFGNLLAAVYGSYQDLASAIFGGDIDYEAIYDDIVANYEAIVCALFNATSATDARTDFLDQLNVTGDDYDFVSNLLYNNILNVLWFAVADSETQLENWVTTVDCDVDCEVECTGTVNLLVGSFDGVSRFTSSHTGDWGGVQMSYGYFNVDGEGQTCGPEATISEWTIISGTPDIVVYNTANQLLYSGTNPTMPLLNVRWWQCRDLDPSTVHVVQMVWV